MLYHCDMMPPVDSNDDLASYPAETDWERPHVAVWGLGPVEEVLPDLELPAWVGLAIKLPDYPELDLKVKVVYAPEERVYEVQEVRIKTPRGAAEILRSIPLQSIVQQAMFYAVSIMASEGVKTIQSWREHPPGDLLSVYTHPARMSVRQRLEPGGPTDGNLTLVARTYRFFRLVGAPPTKLIQEWYDLPRSTATRWIAAARKHGFLDSDEVGRGGGAQSRYSSTKG